MLRLIYTSFADTDLSPAEISQILLTSRRRNEKNGITGLLIYHDRCILQVLEGPEDQVNACFERVRSDKRHSRLRVISRAEAQSKLFSRWFMGYETPGDLTALGQKSMITLDQLETRLNEVGYLSPRDGKRAAIDALNSFLALHVAEQCDVA